MGTSERVIHGTVGFIKGNCNTGHGMLWNFGHKMRIRHRLYNTIIMQI